jgi:hypothetical protein
MLRLMVSYAPDALLPTDESFAAASSIHSFLAFTLLSAYLRQRRISAPDYPTLGGNPITIFSNSSTSIGHSGQLCFQHTIKSQPRRGCL